MIFRFTLPMTRLAATNLAPSPAGLGRALVAAVLALGLRPGPVQRRRCSYAGFAASAWPLLGLPTSYPSAQAYPLPPCAGPLSMKFGYLAECRVSRLCGPAPAAVTLAL